MFYLHNGVVYLSKNQQSFCEVEQLDSVIDQLTKLQTTYRQKKDDDDLDERYTPEGIDRFFQADPQFINDERRWKEDALRDWKHLTGPELFERYQIHAQLYCEYCQNNDLEPSYQGFRHWLVQLRDGIDYHQTHGYTEVY
jgi:hypothetical protein